MGRGKEGHFIDSLPLRHSILIELFSQKYSARNKGMHI